MKKLVFMGFLAISILSYAQETKKPKKSQTPKGFGVSVSQVQPEFPGGEDSLQAFLKNNLVYPQKAKVDRIQGRVYVGFVVDRKGKIVKPRILSGASEELNNEALRVVGLMPDWKPGSAGGSAMDIQYVLPIDFIVPPLNPQPEQQ